MRINRIFLKISGILVLVVLVIGIGVNLALAFVLKDYYPLDEGSQWIYVVIEDEETFEQAVKIEGREIIEGVEAVKVVSSGNSYNYEVIDTEGIKEYKVFDEEEYVICEPPYLVFPNIIEAGEEKQYSTTMSYYTANNEKKKEIVKNGQIKLEAIEDVDVPAGKFTDCLKFSSSYEYQDPDEKSGVNCSVWLASGVGKVKEFCSKVKRKDGEKKMSTELYQLKSAVINGKEISGQ